MLHHRSYDKELLDAPDIPRKDLYQNLAELDIINTYLGGHNVSLLGIKKVLKQLNQPEIKILDIGCGGGDNLRAIEKKIKQQSVSLVLKGVDLKKDCIEYAQSKMNAASSTRFECCDYRESIDKEWLDIVHAALFFHHFEEKEIISFIKTVSSKKRYIIINDLERNPIAYFAIKILTKIFSKSYLVKHDAPLSVARGFKKIEWEKMIKEAGIKNYKISNRWAFRHLIIIAPI
jgi:2-polyprenyl-3-methyl-5-hydroxy-6-metoxy-1,4-benzoquinol methylase